MTATVRLGHLKLAIAWAGLAVGLLACEPAAPSNLPATGPSAGAARPIAPVRGKASASMGTPEPLGTSEAVHQEPAQPKEAPGQASAIGVPTSITGVPLFANPQLALGALVRRDATTTQNHFCVIAYRFGNGELLAWVHWLERNAIILWEPRVDGRDRALIWSRRYLRLDRDVVSSDEELHGSTYRVTKSWVQGIIADCASIGSHFVIEKHPGGD